MDLLTPRTLTRVPPSVARPTYDRATLTTGIVHLGIGAFHRGHEAVYTEAVIVAGDPRWGILGASLRSPEVRDALAPQDFLYTVDSRADDTEALQVIGVLRGVLVVPEDPSVLLTAMADPRVTIVSTTVTEKGYGLDPASSGLDEREPTILHDLQHPRDPRSTLGLLVEALAQRRAAGVAPFTVLCCDNLASNGETLARLTRQFAERRDRGLAHFIADEVAFPSTMLDRIVPATTEDDRRQIANRLGLLDQSPVVAEAYNRWVIEDRFCGPRPDWAAVGVEMVPDIAPYEAIKLKLLNASHSALAYLGYLAGHETIPDATADPVFRAFIEEMMDDEVMPTLNMPASVDAAGYRRSLIPRFANRAVRHRTWQIAMDGSQKLPPRLLGSVRDRLKSGLPFDRLALAVAGWMRYVAGTDERNRPIDVRDPLASHLQVAAAGGTADERVARLLALPQIFGSDLAREPRFVATVTAALERLDAVGARRAVAEQVRQHSL
jgi:fructuronate reductase